MIFNSYLATDKQSS